MSATGTERVPIDTQSEYRVEKRGFSRGAWRVLDANGEQVYRREVFDHPNMGRVLLDGPVCFERKRDALAWVRAQGVDRYV